MAKKKVEVEGSVTQSLPVVAGFAATIGGEVIMIDPKLSADAEGKTAAMVAAISDDDTKKSFVAKFKPFVALAMEWKDKAKNITVTREDDDEGMADARKSRLFVKSVRVALANAHKESKADYLEAGRALDTIKKVATTYFEEAEAYLEEQEKFKEIAEARRRKQLCDKRHELVMPYTEVLPPFTPAFIDGLADMEEPAFNLMLNGAKAALKKKKADEKKAEKERIAAEEAERVRLEEERLAHQKLIEENQRLMKENRAMAPPAPYETHPAAGDAPSGSVFTPSVVPQGSGATRLTDKQILSIAGFVRVFLSKYELKGLQNEDGSAMNLITLFAFGGTKKDGEKELDSLVEEMKKNARDWKIAI